MEEKLKVYFAGSIRGGRSDASLYHRMIGKLKEKAIVLTVHVGDTDLVEPWSDQQIYERDLAWLSGADLLIAECSTPSLGVGYELAFAEKLGLPCTLFYDRSRTSISAMLSGNPYFSIFSYEREEEIYPLLEAVLKKAEEKRKAGGAERESIASK